jgi:hypothetical protein
MASPSVEERLGALETELAELKRRVEGKSQSAPWWEQRLGAFADSPEYDEAMRLGRAYRESLRPSDAGS